VNRKLTIVTTLWKGWRPLYDVECVNATMRMFRKHLRRIPHRFVCFTNEPGDFKCDTMPLWDDPLVPNAPTHHDSFRRLKFFSEWMADLLGGGWITSVDIDCLILRDVTPLVTWNDVRLFKNSRTMPYNGSFWLHKLGTRTHVWNDFDPNTYLALAKSRFPKGKGSDQMWMSYALPGEPVYRESDGVLRGDKIHRHLTLFPKRSNPHLETFMRNGRILFFPGLADVKPWSAFTQKTFPVIYDKYMEFRK
jgi:hypothetical protein